MNEQTSTGAPRLEEYAGLLALVKERVRTAQYNALRVVNMELVGLYWDIGRMIVDRQQEGGWGKSVVERLSVDLQQEFPGIRGFSVQNLWYMRQFYLEYHAYERLQPLVGENENPSIGIILCKEKSRTIVEYALHDARKPIGVATYEITRTLPKELAGQLPNPEEITALLDGIAI